MGISHKIIMQTGSLSKKESHFIFENFSIDQVSLKYAGAKAVTILCLLCAREGLLVYKKVTFFLEYMRLQLN